MHWASKPPTLGKAPPSDWAGIWNGIRYGLIHYFPHAHPKPFHYGHYVFEPSEGLCYPSVWYYYCNLPAYIETQDVQLGDDNSDDANAMDQSPPSDVTGASDQIGSQDQPALVHPTAPAPDASKTDSWTAPAHDPLLKTALDNLVQAWQEGDPQPIAQLLPTDGQVTLKVEGADSYKLSAKDFADLFQDGILDVDTVAYKFVGSNPINGDEIELHAEHQFTDPWGQTRTIDQAYILALENGAYVIREFRTSTYR